MSLSYAPQKVQRKKGTSTAVVPNKTTTPTKKNTVLLSIEEDTIPDSLLHSRWKVQRTVPIFESDLRQNATDLTLPDNLKQTAVYNDTLNSYVIGAKIGGSYLSTPIMMTTEQYLKWSEKQVMWKLFRDKNAEIYKTKGKEKFDFSDMHFDLGPAEKIFGPGGVRIKTQGSTEIKFGATLKNVDNPSLPIRNRKTTKFDFDEKINLNVNGKVGDKVNMNLNYNTDATFDFDAQNLKLKYDGKEDEIIKLVEAGNVSFPSNSSLIKGASSLFGLRTDLQFGKLKLQLVASQKKSSNKSVSSRGGVQLTSYEINVANYEENRHFFLARYFKDKYDEGMRSLPNILTGIKINRVEIWVTNKSGTTTNTRNIVAFTDLGENTHVYNPLWSVGTLPVPSNQANNLYGSINSSYVAARDIDQTSTVLDAIPGVVGGNDYEKLSNARLLNPSEYDVNTSLGYVSLKNTLQTDQVLAVAYEYTYGGTTFQVGEFAQDLPDTKKALFVKSLKNTNNNPKQGNWSLMMKNVYALSNNIEREKFRLDVKYQSDTTGVYLNYLPEERVKNTPLIRVLGADRLDNNNRPHPNGYFDYIEGFTISNGRVFFPVAEPFGSYLQRYLIQQGISANVASKYAFTELYDSTKTVAKQIAEKNKFILSGQYKGSVANVISLGAFNVPTGSVVVTAGGVTLKENIDYSVDYNAGEVTILNQSIIDAGTAVNVSLESNTDFAQQRKTMFGFNWEYNFSKDFQLSGTFQHLSEQALTTKVNMGSEPLNNTLWGVNLTWKKESQWLTNVLDKLPFLRLTQPSNISFKGEFAHLIAQQSSNTQDNASYLDDFENTKNTIDISNPASWVLSSVPSTFAEQTDKTSLSSGYRRSLMAWYNIDPLFTRSSSALTPAHIKGDLNQLSNHYVREVYTRELFPNRNQSSYGGAVSTLPILNIAYYPNERGPYNFNPTLNTNGTLRSPEHNWAGMMRRLDTNDFEAANVEYIEFWMLDPFLYSKNNVNANEYGGDFYLNLGEISEDVLRDGKKFYESGMPVDGSQQFVTTQWGKVPQQATTTYSFATTKGSRALQDVGYNGLTDNEERLFSSYQPFLSSVNATVNTSARDSILNDPANDNYHYFRGSDFDRIQAPILYRYKRINNPQGNSPDTDSRNERYDTSYKTTPDVEDINQDYTLNEYEKYFQYHVSLRPADMMVGKNFIVDKREASPKLRNGNTETVTWYQFRIPVREYQQRIGGINDFTGIRFMRMFLTNFKHPIVIRLGSLDLVRGEWRVYEQRLSNSAQTGRMSVSAVSLEENGDKEPVNYILPPGIRRAQDPTQPQLVENNEQALNLVLNNLAPNEAKAVYKNTSLDIRQYKKMQFFAHANVLEPNVSNLEDNDLAVFIRLGSDYRSNYYEYEIPLKLTPKGRYGMYSVNDAQAVWPFDNMLDLSLSALTDVKKARNRAKADGQASYSSPYSIYDTNKPNNKITIMGNPSLGEIKTLVMGVRNKSSQQKSGEVWINELRLLEYNNKGGWAAQGNLNLQLSDLGTINLQGRYITEGFGGLEEGVNQRSKDDYKNYSLTAGLELGKFFPEKANVSAPLYYSRTQDETRPKYNPLDNDLLLNESLNSIKSKQERDSIESIAVTRTLNTNFSLSNVRIGIQNKRHPMPYDPANFSFSYSHSQRRTSGHTTVYEKEDAWKGGANYAWTPIYKPFEPFKQMKNRSKWLEIIRRFGFNWLPQTVSFGTEMVRNYYELQERDMETLSSHALPLTFNRQFLWNRDFTLRWDLTPNIHMNFQSGTNAEIEEPYTPVNKDLYADKYQAWKDSVWTSVKRFGKPLSYNQSFSLSYQLPLQYIPIFNWLTSDMNYTATYNWMRGSETTHGQNLGNTIVNNRQVNINSTFNLEKLYNQIPFLKKVNEQFNKVSAVVKKEKKKPTDSKEKLSGKDAKIEKEKQALPRNTRAFEKEITLLPDTTIEVFHSKNTKRLIVTARTESGKLVTLKYKKLNKNAIKIINHVDTAQKIKVTVLAKEPLENKSWYKIAERATRLLMMVRNVSVSYRNQYGMGLPGFTPTIGAAMGQTKMSGVYSPGLDFAFGLAGDDYVDKAISNQWLLKNDSIATPATTTFTEDLQIRATLEPFKNFKIDLDAARMRNISKSIQYMYAGRPTTESGSFTMTTISLGSAFESVGNASNGYQSASFDKFCRSLEGVRSRVEAQYAGAIYPEGSVLAGQTFSAANGGINKYSADVMVPAFLQTYTHSGRGSLALFPTLSQLLPNWSFRYSGLSRLSWLRDIFKSVNINHAYKSIFSVGSYSSFSSYQSYMNNLGFITNTNTNTPVPSSMYNVSMVSINESFSPLLGVDVTLHNNLTTRLEFRSTRVLALSMTSVQINESTSKDWVLGLGYRINQFKLFGASKTPHSKNKNNSNNNTSNNNKSVNGVNNSLNLRMDMSYRQQASITRDIASQTSNANMGNTAFKLSFLADYTLSRLVSMSFYYDVQSNVPLLSNNSYPTTTQDFGFSFKFSLTR